MRGRRRRKRKRLEGDEVEEDEESMTGIKLTILRSLNKIEMRMSRRSCYLSGGTHGQVHGDRHHRRQRAAPVGGSDEWV
jgi:hypothetical protein